MWAVARRPRWIAALLLALAIAGGFAALGQWQLERSFESETLPDQQTEKVVSLEDVAQPQSPVLSIASGQLVTLEAELVPGDYLVLSDRINLAQPGYWVVGHAIVDNGASIAVALGWASTEDAAAAAIAELESTEPTPTTLTGRYLPSESPQESDFEAGKRSALAVSELINLWSTAPDGVYGGYLVAGGAASGLEKIDSPAPSTEVSLNLLNVFYAAEWVVFAGFAIFLWWRLVKDAWEREQEESANVE